MNSVSNSNSDKNNNKNNNENSVNEKKPVSKNKDTIETTLSFFKSILYKLITLFIVLFVGISILYGCKVSQSNILPTDNKCFPYESNNISIEKKPINMNVTTIDGINYSQKIYFPYDETNKKNVILDYLRKIKETPKVSSTFVYFVEVIMSMFYINYSLTNGFYHTLNSYLPETIIMFLSPFLMIFSLFLFSFLNIFYFIYSWFSNMSWLFKENTNNTNDGKATWRSVNLFEPFNYFFAWFLVFVFSFLIIFSFGFIFPVLSIFSLFYCLLSPLGISGFTKINNVFQKISLFQFFKSILKDKKKWIMIFISILIITTSFSYFDSILSLLLMFIFVLFWFNIIPNNLYVNKIPENLSKVTSYNLAEKKCSQPKSPVSFNLLDIFKSPPSQSKQQHGGSNHNDDIIHSLKKLSKQFNL